MTNDIKLFDTDDPVLVSKVIAAREALENLYEIRRYEKWWIDKSFHWYQVPFVPVLKYKSSFCGDLPFRAFSSKCDLDAERAAKSNLKQAKLALENSRTQPTLVSKRLPPENVHVLIVDSKNRKSVGYWREPLTRPCADHVLGTRPCSTQWGVVSLDPIMWFSLEGINDD